MRCANGLPSPGRPASIHNDSLEALLQKLGSRIRTNGAGFHAERRRVSRSGIFGECPCECAHALSACRSISVAQLGLLRSRSIASWLSPGALITGSSPALIALSIACAHARKSWDAAQPGSMLHHNRDASETRSLPASFQAAWLGCGFSVIGVTVPVTFTMATRAAQKPALHARVQKPAAKDMG